MPIVTKPNTFTANQIIDANQMNQNFDSIYSLVNGNLDATNIAALGINDFGKLGDEVVIPSKSKGLVYGSDLYKQNWVVAGGLATFPGSPLNQISVNTVSANILQVDGSYRHVSVVGTTYTTSALSTTYFLDLQPDGTMSWGVAHSLQAGYMPLASVTTNGSGNVGVVTDVRVLSAAIAWLNISKSGSSLADLGIRSASDLNSGILPVGRIPTAIPAPSIGNGDVTNTQLSYLNSTTSNIQTQLNAKSTILTGTGSPIGVVTPTVAGQLYLDQTSGLTYTSTGVTSTSWIVIPMVSSMNLQSAINPNMEVWQQGTTFTNPAVNAYTADMWGGAFANTGTLPTAIIHSQVTLTAGELFNSKYAYNINVNGAGSGFGTSDSYYIRQPIEFGTSKLCGNGKKISVSFYAKSSIAAKRIAVSMRQRYGTGGSPSSIELLTPTSTTIRTLSSSLALYTFTFTTNTLTGKAFGTNNDDFLELKINVMWGATIASTELGGGTAETFVGAGDITFTEVVVNAGDVALPFQPKSLNDELIACQRYFEKSHAVATPSTTVTNINGIQFSIVPSNTVAANQTYNKVTFTVRKRTAPTMTIYPYTTPTNTGRVSDPTGTDLAASSGATQSSGETGFVLQNNSGGSLTTIVNTLIFHWTADARL